MPEYTVTLPDGRRVTVDAAQRPTPEQVLAVVGSRRAPTGLPQEPAGEDPSLWQRVIPTALRVGGGIGGAMIGGATGALPGLMAGGAIGAGLGETLAQKYEGEELDPSRIAVQTGLGLIPALKAGGTLVSHLARGAGQGALIGGGAITGESLLRGEGLPPLRDVAGQAALGGVFGGALSGAGRAAGFGRPRTTETRLIDDLRPRGQRPLEDVQGAKGTPRLLVTEGQEAQSRQFAEHGIVQPSAGVSGVDPMRGAERFMDRYSSDKSIQEQLREILTITDPTPYARLGRISVEQQKNLARLIQVDVNRVLPRGMAGNAETVRAYKDKSVELLYRIKDLSVKASGPEGTNRHLAELNIAVAESGSVLSSLRGQIAESARIMNAVGHMKRALATDNPEILAQLFNAPGMKENTRKLLAALGELDPNDIVGRFKVLQKFQGTTGLYDKFRSYYFANILSGVKTHERNIIGNAANSISNLVVSPVAVLADMYAVRTGAAVARTMYFGEAKQQAIGAATGLIRGWKDMLFTFRHGMPPQRMMSSVDNAMAYSKFDLPRVEFGGGAANPFNWPGRMLDGADTLFRSIAKNQELYGLAYAQARKEGLRGQKFINRMADLRSEVTKGVNPGEQKLRERLIAEANRFATRSVFQEQAGPIGRRLQELARIPGMAFVMPFIRTPMNILRQGIEFGPAGFAMGVVKQGGRAGMQAQGRAALGTVALAPLWWLASTGRLSGSGPSDPSERAKLMESGWRPNSVRLGDRWVNIQLFQPISIPAMIMANGVESFLEAGGDTSDVDEVSQVASQITQTVFRAGRSLLDQSFLSGLYDFLEAVDDPERFGQIYVGRLGHALTPFAAAQRTVAQAMDPIIRRPSGASEVFLSSVPGMTTGIAPRISRLGEDVVRPGGPLRRAADPFAVSPVISDPVADELTRLDIVLNLPSPNVTFRGQDLTTTSESETFVRRARGRAVREAVERVVLSPRYATLSDEQRRRLLERAIDVGRNRINVLIRRELLDQLRVGATPRTNITPIGGGQ